MIPKLKSPRSKRYDKIYNKKKSDDKNDKKTIKRDKTCEAVKFNKILEAFNENVKMKNANLEKGDDNDEKDALKLMMGSSSIIDWGEIRSESPKVKKLKRMEHKKSKPHGKQESMTSWLLREKK